MIMASSAQHVSDFFITYTIAITLYTLIIFVLLVTKDTIYKTTFKHFSLFNFMLIFFLGGEIIHSVSYFTMDFENLNCFKNLMIAKTYTMINFLLLVFCFVYFCRTIYSSKIYLRPGKNMISNIYFAYMIVCCILILIFPMELSMVRGTYVIGGLSYIFSNNLSLIGFIPLMYYFIKYIKYTDFYKMIPIFVFFLTLVTADSIEFFEHVNAFEIAMACNLVVIYLSLEKREEKLQKDLVGVTLNLERASRFKSDFLSNMSHELKTPLNAILVTSRSLHDKKEVNDNVKNDINEIVYAADSLQILISNILTLSKIEQSKLTINNVLYSIYDEINSLSFLEKNKVDKDSVSFSIDIDKRIPKQVIGAKDYVKLIIENTLNYAALMAKKGIVSLNVGWDNVDPEHEKLIIKVTNEEDGISNIYENVENLSADIYDIYENASFGVALSYMLCEQLNGVAVVNYNSNKATISYVIPHTKSNSDINLENVSYDNMSALVVDDTALNLKVANRVLTSVNFKTDLASSGKQAIEMARNGKYDVIFLDIMMPEIDGVETLRMLKEIDGFNSKVVALTADEVADARTKYSELGFDGYIVKPFNKTDLINELNWVIGGEK